MASHIRAVDPAFIRKALVAVGLVVLAIFLWKIAPVLMLAFAGAVLATALRAASVPLARRTGMSDLAAVSIVATVALGFLITGGYLFGQRIAEEATALWLAVDAAWQKFAELLGRIPLANSMVFHLENGTDPQAVAKLAKGTFTVFGAILDAILVVFLALYFAADPRWYRRGLLNLVPPGARDRIAGAFDASGRALRRWLVGQLVAMTFVGVLTFLGLWALGVPLALPLAILSALLDFVPVVGPLVAAFPGVLIASAQSPELGFYAMLVYLVVQFIEGNVIMPLAEKWAVSIPPALSLLGIVAFGLVFGVIGLLFAMPLLVVTLVLVQRLYVKPINE